MKAQYQNTKETPTMSSALFWMCQANPISSGSVMQLYNAETSCSCRKFQQLDLISGLVVPPKTMSIAHQSCSGKDNAKNFNTLPLLLGPCHMSLVPCSLPYAPCSLPPVACPSSRQDISDHWLSPKIIGRCQSKQGSEMSLGLWSCDLI